MQNSIGRMGKTLGMVSSMILFGVGIAMLVWPPLMSFQGFDAAVVLIGISGIVQIVQYFDAPKEARSWWLLGCGILILVVAIMILTKTAYLKLIAFSFVLGFAAFMNGFHLFFTSAATKRAIGKTSAWLMFGGFVSLLLGIFFCLYPLMAQALADDIYVIYVVISAVWIFCYSVGTR